MARWSLLLLMSLAVAFASSVAYPTRLQYKKGEVHTFDLHGTLDARGHDASNGFRSGGSYSSLDGMLVTQVTDEDSESYTFSLNLYNVKVGVGQNLSSLQLNTLTSHDEPLGDNAYFQQLFTGEIKKIWYSSQDSPYFVEVKAGAINAFQTHLLAPGTQQQISELDPVGTHFTLASGVAGPSILNIVRNFTQADVTEFTDPNVRSGNVAILAQTVTGVSLVGQVESSAVDQTVDLVNVNRASSNDDDSGSGDDTSTAVDVTLSSQGHMSITRTKVAGFRLPSTHRSMTNAQLQASDLRSGTLLEVARHVLSAKRLAASALDDAAVELRSYWSELSDGLNTRRTVEKLVRYFRARPASAFAPLQAVIEEAVSKQQPDVVSGLFHLLARVGTEPAQQLLIDLGLQSSHLSPQLQAVLASYSVQHPSPSIIAALHRVMQAVKSPVARPAMFAFGSALAKSDAVSRDAGVTALVHVLERAMKTEDDEMLAAALLALSNARPNAAEPLELTRRLLKSESKRVQRAARHAFQKLATSNMLSALALPATSEMPFNRSWSDEYSLGGKQIYATFSAEAFAGSNFDCSQVYFNYEVLGAAAVNITIFQWTKAAFIAQAVYGKSDGQPLADSIYVEAWDQVIYDKPLPQLNCSAHTLPIGHKQTGLDVEYTLWISIIPVEFSVSATLDLALSVEWQVCDSMLSASVSLLPSATLTVGGQAQLDLLVIKAGVELNGAFESLLIPTVKIDGVKCSAGLEATLENKPLSVTFDGYYAVNKCKLWIFDCHWGKEHVNKWLDWNYPAHSTVLYNQVWNITV